MNLSASCWQCPVPTEQRKNEMPRMHCCLDQQQIRKSAGPRLYPVQTKVGPRLYPVQTKVGPQPHGNIHGEAFGFGDSRYLIGLLVACQLQR